MGLILTNINTFALTHHSILIFLVHDLQTEEERAEETRFRSEQEARKTTSEMRVMLRKK